MKATDPMPLFIVENQNNLIFEATLQGKNQKEPEYEIEKQNQQSLEE